MSSRQLHANTNSENIQFRNVGNLGDIIKHDALFRIADFILDLSKSKTIYYIDTHTFLQQAPCVRSVEEWKSIVEKNHIDPSSEYVSTELKHISSEGVYRCSSGLMIDKLVSAESNAVFLLSEANQETHALLRSQIQNEGKCTLLPSEATGSDISTCLVRCSSRDNAQNDASATTSHAAVTFIMKHSTELASVVKDHLLASPSSAMDRFLVCLVDPFLLIPSEWQLIANGIAQFKNALAGGVIEVFTYDRNVQEGETFDWSPFPAPEGFVGPVAVRSSSPYHLAVYATPNIAAEVRRVLYEKCAWTTTDPESY